MSDLQYKGYRASVEFCADDELLVGKVADIEALIMFSADTVADLKREFHAAIDEYLEDCARSCIEPEKAYKGSFNVRIGSEDHRKAAKLAHQCGITLNELMKVAVYQLLDRQVTANSLSTLLTQAAFEPYGYPSQNPATELSRGQPYTH